eukprot:6190308-Pleurochrysis_carterae.AAC.5
MWRRYDPFGPSSLPLTWWLALGSSPMSSVHLNACESCRRGGGAWGEDEAIGPAPNGPSGPALKEWSGAKFMLSGAACSVAGSPPFASINSRMSSCVFLSASSVSASMCRCNGRSSLE